MKKKPKKKLKTKTPKKLKKKSSKKIKKKTAKKTPQRKISRVKTSERRKERRLNPRLPIAARVSWQEAGSQSASGNAQEHYYFTRNISGSGLFLLTDHPPPLKQFIDIQLSVQFLKDPLKVRGEVVRHESASGRFIGFGVRFSENPERLNLLMQELEGAIKKGHDKSRG